jgi:hypothetical protein
MSELVERLRDHALFNKQDRCLMFIEAADRIEALEAALRKIDTHLDNFGYLLNMKARKIARAALAPEQDK